MPRRTPVDSTFGRVESSEYGRTATSGEFPDRGDFPAGEQDDRDYIQAVEQNRLDAVNAGRNVVGPVRHRGRDPEPQRPGFLGVDFPNAVTATVGYTAAAVTAPALAGFNAVFGTEIDVGIVGTALADGIWSAFGYDVDAPTTAESQALSEIGEANEQHTRENDSDGDGRITSNDSDYDGDGISDTHDNTDDSGDPSGGHDGGV